MRTRGFTVWLTGLSGAGKSTLADLLAATLRENGHLVEVLDGDVVRTHLSRGLGFTKEDRDTNILRIGFVCELLTRNGVVAIAAAISPYRDARNEVRRRIGAFFEVHVRCPIDVLEERDTKGLYAKALRGELPNFTGISDPYEEPLSPELVLDTSTESPPESLRRLFHALELAGLVDAQGLPFAASAPGASDRR
jgi:adenylylsulfate kinase